MYKEDLIKALSEPEPKPETPNSKPEIPKPKPERKPKPEPEPNPEIRVNKGKLKKLGKDFDELSHKFSKEEIKDYRKSFYVAKNKKISF